MTAGVPGAGIGGIYYILLAFLMPVREAWLTCQRRSSLQRWADILLQTANAGGIVISVWLTGWFLARTFLHRHIIASVAGANSQLLVMQTANIVSLTSACAALVSLGTVIIAVNVLRFLVPKRPLT